MYENHSSLTTKIGFEKLGVQVDGVNKVHNLVECRLTIDNQQRLITVPDTTHTTAQLQEHIPRDMVSIMTVNKQMGEPVDVGPKDNLVSGKQKGQLFH